MNGPYVASRSRTNTLICGDPQVNASRTITNNGAIITTLGAISYYFSRKSGVGIYGFPDHAQPEKNEADYVLVLTGYCYK
jgi:hypothetical protein